jgi:hypothetical protein
MSPSYSKSRNKPSKKPAWNTWQAEFCSFVPEDGSDMFSQNRTLQNHSCENLRPSIRIVRVQADTRTEHLLKRAKNLTSTPACSVFPISLLSILSICHSFYWLWGFWPQFALFEASNFIYCLVVSFTACREDIHAVPSIQQRWLPILQGKLTPGLI